MPAQRRIGDSALEEREALAELLRNGQRVQTYGHATSLAPRQRQVPIFGPDTYILSATSYFHLVRIRYGRVPVPTGDAAWLLLAVSLHPPPLLARVPAVYPRSAARFRLLLERAYPSLFLPCLLLFFSSLLAPLLLSFLSRRVPSSCSSQFPLLMRRRRPHKHSVSVDPDQLRLAFGLGLPPTARSRNDPPASLLSATPTGVAERMQEVARSCNSSSAPASATEYLAVQRASISNCPPTGAKRIGECVTSCIMRCSLNAEDH